MLLAPDVVKDELAELTTEFIQRLATGDYEHIWENLFSFRGMETISTASFPLYLQSLDQLEALMEQPLAIDGFALAFQQDKVFPNDTKGIRSGFFDGIANSISSFGWSGGLSAANQIAFLDGNAAILVGETAETNRPLFLLFVVDGHRGFKVDIEALSVFSMVVTAQQIHRLASKAMESGLDVLAMSLYELTAGLGATYDRIRRLMWAHPLIASLVTEQRRFELQAEYAYTTLAQEQFNILSADRRIAQPSINTAAFLDETFRGYGELLTVEITDLDVKKLHSMSDLELRRAVAKTLFGVNQVEALREAQKPHSPAEIADMELMVQHDGEIYHLLMPFKSGLEIRSAAVPVDVFYQIFRAHLFFEKGIVVFITSKPCSQYLHNLIKLARERKNWPMAVIENTELAALLKVNGLL